MRIILTAARVNVSPGYRLAAMTGDAGTSFEIARAMRTMSVGIRAIPKHDAGSRGWKPRAAIPALLRSGFFFGHATPGRVLVSYRLLCEFSGPLSQAVSR
jgi:hypothetical protein